jgi:hypothetical protein
MYVIILYVVFMPSFITDLLISCEQVLWHEGGIIKHSTNTTCNRIDNITSNYHINDGSF